MAKLFALLLSAIMVLSLTACAGNAESAPSDSGNSAPSDEQITNESSGSQEAETAPPESTAAPETDSSEETDSGASDSKILIAAKSRCKIEQSGFCILLLNALF